jgi:hypothetical protein
MPSQALDRGPHDNIIYWTDYNTTASDLTWERSGTAEEWNSKELQNMANVHMHVYETFLFTAKFCTHILFTAKLCKHIYATMEGGW